MAEIVESAEAVQALVGEGHSVALEGFTHLIPFAAGRRGRPGEHGVGAADRPRPLDDREPTAHEPDALRELVSR